MMYRTTLAFSFAALLVAAGCSAVVNNTLKMKDDAGTGDTGTDTGTGGCSEPCGDFDPCLGSFECNPGHPDADPANGCLQTGDPLPEGATCNFEGEPPGVCRDTFCEYCGDEEVNGDEQCDDGRNGADDDGCTDECVFSCDPTDDNCDDDFECNGVERCTMSAGGRGFQCVSRMLPAPGSPCDQVDLGVGGMCVFPDAPDQPPLCCAGTPMGPECCTVDDDGDFVCEIMPPAP